MVDSEHNEALLECVLEVAGALTASNGTLHSVWHLVRPLDFSCTEICQARLLPLPSAS